MGILKMSFLPVLIALASYADNYLPFEVFKEFEIGLYTGFFSDPGNIADTCLPKAKQIEYYEEISDVLEDWADDVAFSKFLEDIAEVIEDFFEMLDGCWVLLIPERIIASLFEEGLIALIVRFVSEIYYVGEYFGKFVENLVTDPGTAGTYLGKMFALFLTK